MNILIIGGCGYIGSSLFTHLSLKHNVETVDLELYGNFVNQKNIKMDYENLEQSYLDKFDVIILTAANSSMSLCKDIFDTFNNNVVKFYKLVTKLKKQKFIYASSSCVYTNFTGELKDENDLIDPVDGLTLSKTTIDYLMKLTNIEYYGLRFGSVNGWSPNMRLDLMINSMTLSAKNNKKVYISNGESYRPILFIDDLVSSVEKIIDCKEDKRGIYNLVSFNEKISNIGKKVASLTNSELIDQGNNFTYNFKISSLKFYKTFGDHQVSTLESIVNSVLNGPENIKWSKR